ncbi:MAG: hypothetical protein ACE5JU_02000 [Candidatus Binatia bacterium]
MWRTAGILFYIGLGVSVLADFLIGERDHPVFWWHHTPAFDFVLGLAACLLIIKGSKFLTKHWLQRAEDYYD